MGYTVLSTKGDSSSNNDKKYVNQSAGGAPHTQGSESALIFLQIRILQFFLNADPDPASF